MKISRHRNPRTCEVYLRPFPLIQREISMLRSKKPRKDENVLSSRAAEVRRLRELAKTIPDIRQDKIDTIKKQIESGVYNASGESVAESISKLHCALMRDKSSRS